MKKNKSSKIYDNVIVKKPWGYEYLIFQNKILAIWLLNIKPGGHTSLHCHPMKKTGLIILSGVAEIELGFYETVTLSTSGKLMIRPGLFHATRTISSDDAILLELETPIDKEDLVRFKDEYGRQEKPYEGTDSMIELTDEFIKFMQPELNKPILYKFGEVNITIEKWTEINSIVGRPRDTIFAILDGGLISKSGKFVLSAGDIVYSDTIDKLSEVFKPAGFISLITVTRNSH